MSKKLKPIPKFRSEAEERRFWETHDSSDYVNWVKAERARLTNLKPSTASTTPDDLEGIAKSANAGNYRDRKDRY